MNPEGFDFFGANTKNLPGGYPSSFTPDAYSREPFLKDYEQRKETYLTFCSNNPARSTIKGHLFEYVRIAEGKETANLSAIEGALDFIDKRIDCSDFVLLGILRLLLQFGDAISLSDRIIEKAKETVLGFKYWPDEPGRDSMCTWTENHQILFSVCE